MKVVEAKIYLAEIGGRHPVLVQVFTDEGISGVGEAAIAYGTGATATAGMIKDLVDVHLLGKDPFPIEAIWSEMYDHTFWAKGAALSSSPASVPLNRLCGILRAKLWDCQSTGCLAENSEIKLAFMPMDGHFAV